MKRFYSYLLMLLIPFSGTLNAGPLLGEEVMGDDLLTIEETEDVSYLLISEVLADPARNPSLGDANRDGAVSSSADEFVELFNTGTQAIDISGYALLDRVKSRHIFPEGSVLNAGETLIVFGGGDLSGWGDYSGVVQGASSGSLGLNNAGDQVSLLSAEGESIIELMYSRDGGQDQSLELFAGDLFRPHQSLLESVATAHSAGSLLAHQIEMIASSETPASSSAQVPEPSVFLLFLLGGLTLMMCSSRKLKNARISLTV